MSHGCGKSDCCVVPKKLPNKAVGEIPAVAEAVEGRRQAKGNVIEAHMSRTPRRTYDVHSALDGIRQTAKGNRQVRFTTLMHHVYAAERLEAAYLALKRDAAPAVAGQTWTQYGQALQDNLRDLSARLARGGYHAKPVRRVYIDKADGSKRPLGVPALEDKIVQKATVEVLNAIYEQDFLGFSYGFRPAKSAHNALDAVAVGVGARKVNWLLDADIAKFFDTTQHDWLVKFIEHRVADTRIVRSIRKWLSAGVLEDGRRTQSELGTVQGGSISALLANIYLHYAFDLWVEQWRGRYARGDMIAVRYADDWVAGFQFREDAERFKCAVEERLGQFGLKLHPEKTRLIEFGRFAQDNRRRRGQGKPDTFNSSGSRIAAAEPAEASSWCSGSPAANACGPSCWWSRTSCESECIGPLPSRASTCARWWADMRAASPCPATGRVCRPSTSRSAGCGTEPCADAARPST